MYTEKIGAEITKLRKEKNVTQEELARYVGVSAQAVSKWENGGVPDTELLPQIADFFGVSTDTLFGRTVTDYSDVQTSLMKKIVDTPPKERFAAAFDCCWSIERALSGRVPDDGDIQSFQKKLDPQTQCYSSMLSDYGFTRMGIANRLQYFLIVPEAEDKEAAFFNGIDYPAFFKDFSDREVFEACRMLHKRDHRKAFTHAQLMKKMGVESDRAKEIIDILSKYGLISATQIEMDDEEQEIYTFRPNPSFTAMLIFVREIIEQPNRFFYFYNNRTKPYLE